ncbi:MAG TPA: hypothetical protein DCS63_06990, partial [Elusimicrobia bacterium]|nr:hypothetical protein [Elusimicrobiota bacterium]
EVDFECRAGIVEEIVIHPDYRKLGIGRSMLGTFDSWCAAKGAKGVLVPCGRAGFYEKMGFEKLPVTRYWKDLPENVLAPVQKCTVSAGSQCTV